MRELMITAIAIAIGSSIASADSDSASDGKLTEKQVVSCIEMNRLLRQQSPATQEASPKASATLPDSPLVKSTSRLSDAVYANHGLTPSECRRVDAQIKQLLPAALTQIKTEINNQIATREADLTAAKTKLAAFEQAQKNGKRVPAAQDNSANMGDEIKADEAALKPITDEIASHDKEATDDEALAKDPPANIAEADRAAYIDRKKNEEQAAQDAAKESRERLKEAQKNLDDATARMQSAGAEAARPEVPTTDIEKQQVRQGNEKAILEAHKSIQDAEQSVRQLKTTLAAVPDTAPADPNYKVDPDNLSLVKKHAAEYLDATGNSALLNAK